MWVQFKKTYVGQFGLFLSPLKYDLDAAVVKAIKKDQPDTIVNCDPPPWSGGSEPKKEAKNDKPKK